MKESSKVEKTCENLNDFFEDFFEDLTDSTDLTNHKIPNMVRSYQLHTSQKNIVIVRGPFVRSYNPADHKENISSTTYVIFGGIAARILQLGYCNNLNSKNLYSKNLYINDLIKVVEQLFLQEEETNPDKQNALEQVAYAIMAKAASNSSNNLLRKDIAEYCLYSKICTNEFYSKKLNRKLSEQEKEKILSDMGLAAYSKMTPLNPTDMLELSWSGQVPHWAEVLPDLDAAFGKIRDEEKTPLEAPLEAPLESFFRNEKEMLQQIKKEKEEELEKIREELFATFATTDTDHDLIIDQNYYNFSGEYDAGDQPQWSLKIFKSFEDWEISLDLKN